MSTPDTTTLIAKLGRSIDVKSTRVPVCRPQCVAIQITLYRSCADSEPALC